MNAESPLTSRGKHERKVLEQRRLSAARRSDNGEVGPFGARELQVIPDRVPLSSRRGDGIGLDTRG